MDAPDHAVGAVATSDAAAALPPTGLDLNGAPVWWAVSGVLALVALLALIDRRFQQ
jgi:hypothetical protein